MISVIIVNYHCYKLTVRATESVLAQDLNTQIIVVDNSTDLSESQALQTNLSPEVKCIVSAENIGFGRGHNLSILPSSAKYHLILNPDVVLDPDCLIEGITYLEKNNNVCAVTPFSTDGKGNVQYLAKRYPTVIDLFLRGLAPRIIKSYFQDRLNNYESRDIVNQNTIAMVDLISGCFMLCRTDYLKKIGGFDERYFLYFEDFALSMELQKFGVLHYLPSMKIIHYGGDTAQKGLKHIIMFVSSSSKFFNQYGWKFF